MIVARRGAGWLPEQLALTSFVGFDGSGDLDLRISTYGDRTWVVWEHAPGTVSWSVLESGGSWSAPEAEPIGEPGGEEAARARIQRKVLSR